MCYKQLLVQSLFECFLIGHSFPSSGAIWSMLSHMRLGEPLQKPGPFRSLAMWQNVTKDDQDSRYIKIQATTQTHIYEQKYQLVKVPEHIRCFASLVAANYVFPLSLDKFPDISDDTSVTSGLYDLHEVFPSALAMSWSVLICMSAQKLQKPALLPFCTVSCSLTKLLWKSSAFLTHLRNICGIAQKLRTSLYFQKVSHE